MCKKLCFLVSVVLLMALSTNAWALYINDTQEFSGDQDIQDFTDKTLEIGPSGHVTFHDRVNMDDGAQLIMSGGTLITEDTFKFPDSSDTQDVQAWINSGTWTANEIENRAGDGRGDAIYVGGGALIVQTGYLQGTVGDDDNEWYDPNIWLNNHTYDGHPVLMPGEGYIEVIITDDGGGACTITAVSGGPMATYPNPARAAKGVCPDPVVLSWTPTDEIADPNHDVYLDPNQNHVDQATRQSHGDVLYYSENQDSNEYTVPAALELNTTYYWRVDEVDNADPCVWETPVIWSFTTEDGNAIDPSPADGLRGWNPSSPLNWTPSCVATAQELYLSTDFNDVNELQGTPYELGPTDNNIAPALNAYTRYYWRVVTVGGGDGEVWTFKTGYGGLLMHFSFDGGLGGDILPPVTDDTGNFTFLRYDGGGSLKYGQPRFSAGGGTSADFDPNVGLHRSDPCEPTSETVDPLRLDGYQYTVELWIKPETLNADYGDITLIGKPGESSWRLRIVDPGGSNELQQTHNGNNETEGQIQVGEWQHIAAVWDQLDPDEEQMRLYYNGDLINTNDEGPNPSDNNAPVGIGMERRADGTTGGYFDGLIDEVKIWDIIVLPVPGCSTNPNPPHLADRVDPCDTNDTVLTWTPGPFADQHDVYFGTDANVVYQGTVDGNMYPEVGNLVLEQGKTYYWRINDVNGGDTYEGFLWSFSTQAVIEDPNMVVWYKFDETGGDDVMDSSGHYNHAEIDDTGDDTWDPNDGRFYPGCISFHDNEDMGIADEVFDYIGESISISVWWKDTYGHGENNFCAFGDDDVHMLVRGPDGESDNPGVIWQAGNDTNDLLTWKTNAAWRDNWHHLVFTKNGPEGTMKIYFDTTRVAFTDDANGTTLSQAAANEDEGFVIGAGWDGSNHFTGKADDFRVYDYEISQDKINELFRGGDVEYAWAPEPIDGAIDVLRDVDLTWKPGDYTQNTGGHKVYFGTDWDDVNDMTDPCATRNLGNELYDPGQLELGQTYYWRVDEVNDTNTWKGNVWSFTVAKFVVLDDFESYDKTNNLIYYTWYCKQAMPYGRRSGAILSLSTSIVHGGEQAMNYYYETDNTEIWDQDYAYADACLPLDEIDGFQDWTTVDVRLLTIFFYGQAGNDTDDTEQMYMGVHDSAGRYAEMRYGDNTGEAMSNLKVEEWQRWDVPFVWYTDSNFAAVSANIDFSAISSVYLGFGNRFNPIPAGNGAAYFDDLRLSMPFCNPEYGPIGDLSGDCFVGVADIGAMGDQWLRHDINVNPVTEPPTDDPNLVAHWKLDGNTTDSSTWGYHGTAEGAYEWTSGKDGQAIDLSGGWVVVEDNDVTPKLRPKHYVSVMAWVYLDEELGSDSFRVVIKGRNDNETFGLEVDNDNRTLTFLMRDANELDEGDPKLYDIEGERALPLREWIHIAGTYDANEMTSYINGEVEGTTTPGPYELYSDPNDGLGIGGRYPASDTSGRFEGKIDDVRVYDRAVTRAEIGYIASGGDGLIPLESEANLVSGEDPEVINFRDFAKLFDYWGDEQLWPPEPAP